jgi:hypothetical protein
MSFFLRVVFYKRFQAIEPSSRSAKKDTLPVIGLKPAANRLAGAKGQEQAVVLTGKKIEKICLQKLFFLADPHSYPGGKRLRDIL